MRLRRARICSASTHDSPFRLLAWANSRCSFSAYQSGDCAAAQRLPHALIRLQVRRTQDFLPDRALARHHIEVMVRTLANSYFFFLAQVPLPSSLPPTSSIPPNHHPPSPPLSHFLLVSTTREVCSLSSESSVLDVSRYHSLSLIRSFLSYI